MTVITELGSVDEDKRQARLQQLEEAESKRQEAWDKRREGQSTAANPEESVAAFLAAWESDKEVVLAALESLKAKAVAESPQDRADIKAAADELTTHLFKMDRDVSGAAYFLPAFEVRSLTATMKQLRAELQSTREKKLPRQPFAFSNPDAIVIVSDPQQQGLKSRLAMSKGEQRAPEPSPAASTLHDTDDATTIREKRQESIALSAAELQGKDWALEGLQECTIKLHGPLQALHLHRLQDCTVEAGPIGGATFGEDLRNCVLRLATHQLRLHHTVDTQVHVLPGSDPIIEHCSGVGFAPLPALEYEGFTEAARAAGLPDNVATSKWANVQDFQYPGHKTSPNWHALDG